MGLELEDWRDLKSLTTDELKQLWVEACGNWAINPDIEPGGTDQVEAELDLRNEGLPFLLVRQELAILAGWGQTREGNRSWALVADVGVYVSKRY